MTNEDYIQWEPLLKKVAYKYRDNAFKLEVEDLMQIGAIGLMYAFDTYKEDKGASKVTYFYKCIEWKIIREFQNLRRVKRFCSNITSLDAPAKDAEGEEATVGSVIPDDKVNVENTAIDEIEVKKVIDEIERVLTGRFKSVMLCKIFDTDLSSHEIAIACDIEKDEDVKVVYSVAKEKLWKKSYYVQLKYYKFLIRQLKRPIDQHNMTSYIRYKDRIRYLSRLLANENKKKLVKK